MPTRNAANLFLHYAFDRWMAKEYPQMPFERYADDAIVHCRTERAAQGVRAAIAARLKECGLSETAGLKLMKNFPPSRFDRFTTIPTFLPQAVG
jgi:retron-type reverse transcriptase